MSKIEKDGAECSGGSPAGSGDALEVRIVSELIERARRTEGISLVVWMSEHLGYESG